MIYVRNASGMPRRSCVTPRAIVPHGLVARWSPPLPMLKMAGRLVMISGATTCSAAHVLCCSRRCSTEGWATFSRYGKMGRVRLG